MKPSSNKKKTGFGGFSDATFFYAHAAIFAFSEIIFILSLPIYLYTQGFSLSFIFLFHGVTGLVGYFFTRHVVAHILKTDIKHILILGVLFYIAFGFTTSLVTTENYWWLLALLFLSLQSLLYFPARHLFFVEIADRGTVGLQTGVLNAVSVIARVIAPLIAGWVASVASFNAVFLLGAILMILCVLPILFIQKKVKIHFDLKDFLQMQKTHLVFTKTRFAYLADGMNNVLSYLMWPLFFFLLLTNESFFQLGSLMTVTSAISAGIMVLVGHLFDRKHRKKLLSTSIITQITASLFRFSLLFFHPGFFIYGVQSLYAFSESALQSTFDSYLYAYGKVTNTAFFTIHREINFSLGKFLLCFVLALATFFISSAEHLWFFFLLSIPILFLYSRKMRVDHFLKDQTE
ncbi:hypothetical protein COY07_05840 [Candidatus Peregrinibacteria bacterium CG_4_10_14_0_2_um_filter_43_11]|nr:MAG: hypothetical protein COY07_05840 [Candidatus Peregrinibacteria bacterium CG_4_10_14_0_2_um_filter_43_11]